MCRQTMEASLSKTKRWGSCAPPPPEIRHCNLHVPFSYCDVSFSNCDTGHIADWAFHMPNLPFLYDRRNLTLNMYSLSSTY